MRRTCDLTLPLVAGMSVWPGDPEVSLQPHLTIHDDGARVTRLSLGSHSGTHVDAPAHLIAGGATVEEIDPALLCGPAHVLDLSQAKQIGRAALESLSPPSSCQRVLLRTENSLVQRLRQPTFDPDYVALTEGGARWLVDSGVRLVGIDALSVDAFDAEELPAHHILLEHGVVIVEGLDLCEVPAGCYELICAPLLLPGADAAPARVFLREP